MFFAKLDTVTVFVELYSFFLLRHIKSCLVIFSRWINPVAGIPAGDALNRTSAGEDPSPAIVG